MTEVAWWGQEARPAARARLVAGAGPAGGQPELLDGSAGSVRSAIQTRIPGFTPEWTNLARGDAGVALVRLFGTLAEPVLARVNRLPEKVLVEHLRIADVKPLPATVASALLTFTISPAAQRSVLVPTGFQAGADPAVGDGDQVVFETDRALHATPATVGSLAVEDRGLISEADLEGLRAGRPLLAFGANPEPGNALWIGLSADPAIAAPAPTLSVGIVVAAPAEAPPPAGSGGLAPLPVPPSPLLRWELLDGARTVPVQPQRDDTNALRSSGVVELRLPRSWGRGQPPGAAGLPERLWLRVQLAHGEFPAPPAVAAILVNVARADAARTIRDETLERVPDDPGDGRTRLRVRQAPVQPRTLDLVVEDDPLGDVFGTGRPPAGPPPPWREVTSLAASGPDDRVFVLDHAAGVLSFGDGEHGVAIPEGLGNVRAARYRAGGGAAGRVGAEAISTPLTSVAFVTGVTNPYPASGGVDAEAQAATVLRGTEELRSGGRAVTPADYAAQARRADGAEVARAHGVPGLHPDFPGDPIPGVVGVLVVSRDRDGDPPVPTEADLQAVARHLARHAAPAGVQVVAAAPRFHRVRVEALLVLDPDQAQADVIRAAGDALDLYLHPLRGGDAGTGWPFGGALRHVALVRRLLDVGGVLAVPQLNVVLDGRRHPPCTDRPITANALVWPDGHELVPVEQEST